MDPLAYRLLDVVRNPDDHVTGCEGRPRFQDPTRKDVKVTCSKCRTLEQRYAGSTSIRSGEIVTDIEYIRDQLCDALIVEVNRAKDLAYESHGVRGRRSARPGTGKSDPTGETAVSERHNDVRLDIRNARQQVSNALLSLEGARHNLIHATARADHSRPRDVPHPYRDAYQDVDLLKAQRKREGLCVTCGEKPAIVHDRCRTCHNYRERTGRERSQRLIRTARGP